MNEEVLNQELTAADSDSIAEEEEGLFDDYTEEEDIPASSEDDQDSEHTEEEESSEDTQKEQNAPFLTVKFNKESRNLSQQEAVEYAQKGLNYDKIYESYSAMKHYEPSFNELSRLAQINNMSIEDYVANLANVQREVEIEQEMEALKGKYPNSEENVLKELATLQVNERRTAAADKMKSAKQQDADSRKQEIGRQLDIFTTRYPDLNPQSLDSKVYDLMKDGYTLLEAYETVEAEKRSIAVKEKESQEKISRKNEENKKKSMGNTTNVGSIETDAFLDGWNS